MGRTYFSWCGKTGQTLQPSAIMLCAALLVSFMFGVSELSAQIIPSSIVVAPDPIITLSKTHANYNPATPVSQRFTITGGRVTATLATTPPGNPTVVVRDVSGRVKASLATGQTVTIGSPVSVGPTNNGLIVFNGPIVVELVDRSGNTFGSFALVPGESMDVQFMTTPTGEYVVMLQNIVGTVTVTIAGQPHVMTAGRALFFFSPHASQTISFAALGNKAFGDADFTVGATASSGLMVGFTASGSCAVSGSTVHLTGVGSCTITASQAGDSNYNPATPVSQTFTISAGSGEPPPPTPPTVSLTAPLNGAAVSGTVTISANASDNAGAPSVQFQLDGASLGGALTTPPYSILWNTTGSTNGNHTLSVAATNFFGLTAQSTITVTVNNLLATMTYSIPASGSLLLATADDPGPNLNISHVRAQQDVSIASHIQQSTSDIVPLAASSNVSLAGIAMLALRTKGVLVAEESVPASREIPSGRIYAETHGAVTTGIAFSNLTMQDAQISFSFTDATGKDTGSGSFVLPANHQISGFLNKAPFNGPADMQGSFSFTSSVPVSVTALRGLTNERGEFLVTTLPIASDVGSPVLSQFADGAGWITELILMNPTIATEVGTLQFFGQGSASQNAPLLTMNVNGVSGTSFSYSIPPHGLARLVTAGTSSTIQVGSIRLAPTILNPFSNRNVPSAVGILSFRNNGITVTEASVPALPSGSAFQMYIEYSGTPGQAGSILSGLAVANTASNPVSIFVDLTKFDGTPSGFPTATFSIPAGGQISKFINELFPRVPTSGFQGIARLTATSAVSITSLHTRYNERGDFLITSTPPLDEAANPTNTVVFPHVVSGGGYSTQIILFGQAGSGKLYIVGQDGTPRPSSMLKK